MKKEELKSILTDEKEEVLSVIGNEYIEKFLATGKIDRGFAVLSDERVYFKGESLTKKGSGFFKSTHDRAVDLIDVSAGGFIHNRNIAFKVLKIIFFVYSMVLLGSIVLIGIFTGGAAFFAAGSLGALVMVGTMFGLYLLFRFLEKAHNYSVFQISYAGGHIGFDMNFTTQEECEAFQKKLIKAKDKKRSEQLEMLKTAKEKKENDSGIGGADEIIKLKQLFDDGIITSEEFEAKKKQILG